MQVNKGLLLLHVLECDAAGAPTHADAGDDGAAAAAAAAAAPPATATSALDALRVVEVCVARWNPNKGRLEAQVMGV